MRYSLLTLIFPLLLSATELQAKRRFMAKKFALIPESQALLKLGAASRDRLDPDSIKVMVWNVKKAQEKQWGLDFSLFAANRDLILLQETYLNHRMISIFSYLEQFHWELGVAFLYNKDNNIPTGTAIGSMVAPSFAVVKHSRDHEPLIDTPKALTIARYPIEGMEEQLLVISIHALNFVRKKFFARHIDQALSYIDHHKGPVIFAGDFNTNTRSKEKYLFKKMSGRGFQNVDFKNHYGRMRFFKYFGKYLDYAFVRGLYVKDAWVQSGIFSSDHQPLFLELQAIR